ncbi:unnamed protein product [Camellia sinensis]
MGEIRSAVEMAQLEAEKKHDEVVDEMLAMLNAKAEASRLKEVEQETNAWEEGDEVVLITCRLENPDLDMVNGPVKEKLENFGNELYEMRFNMKTGLASQRKLSAPAVDFPRVNESYTGRKQRFVYATTLDSIAKVTGIIKFDLHAEPESGKTKLEVGGNIQGIFDLGPHRFGSEAIFVPRDPGVTSEEDDGYLIFFVHDEVTGRDENPAQFVLKQRYMNSKGQDMLAASQSLTDKSCYIIKFLEQPNLCSSGLSQLQSLKSALETSMDSRVAHCRGFDIGIVDSTFGEAILRKSAVNVIDAKSMSADPVAVVELPHRVPYGFHALFVTE